MGMCTIWLKSIIIRKKMKLIVWHFLKTFNCHPKTTLFFNFIKITCWKIARINVPTTQANFSLFYSILWIFLATSFKWKYFFLFRLASNSNFHTCSIYFLRYYMQKYHFLFHSFSFRTSMSFNTQSSVLRILHLYFLHFDRNNPSLSGGEILPQNFRWKGVCCDIFFWIFNCFLKTTLSLISSNSLSRKS